MNRPHAKPAMALVMASILALSVPPAHAEVTLILQSSHLEGTRTETRYVPTSNIKPFTGAKTLLKAVPFTEETITGPTTKVIKDWEARTTRNEVWQHYLDQEEQRTVDTRRLEYIRRTSTEEEERSWIVWHVGGTLKEGYRIKADLVNIYLPPDGNYRNVPWPYLAGDQKSIERTHADYLNANAFAVQIYPYAESALLASYLVFDRKTLKFLGGTMTCHGHNKGNPDMVPIPSATLIQHADYDEIEYRLNCVNNERWWALHCDTGDVTWKLRVNGKIIENELRKSYRTVSSDEPYVAYADNYGSWKPTGNTQKGGLAHTQPLYETITENVLVNQRNAVHGGSAVKGIATASNVKQRRIFSADSSSAQSRASLSGTQVRRALGADQARASQLASSRRGAGAPELPVELPGRRVGQGGSHPVTPTPAPEAAANATPSAPVATKPVPLPPLNVKEPVTPDTWTFPKNPSKPPARRRGDTYFGRRG